LHRDVRSQSRMTYPSSVVEKAGRTPAYSRPRRGDGLRTDILGRGSANGRLSGHAEPLRDIYRSDADHL
jgi:hypothetical protein